MKTKITKDDNFLDLIPKKSNRYEWKLQEDNLVRIIIPRDNLLEKTVRLFFKTPETMKIDLDEMGSLVWQAIDNERDIEAIGEILKQEMKEAAEPLYQRLGTYINILRNNKFIELTKVCDRCN